MSNLSANNRQRIGFIGESRALPPLKVTLFHTQTLSKSTTFRCRSEQYSQCSNVKLYGCTAAKRSALAANDNPCKSGRLTEVLRNMRNYALI